MLYEIVQIKKGKETIKMIDSLSKCNNRLKELRNSYRGIHGIKFLLRESLATDKYESKPIPYYG